MNKLFIKTTLAACLAVFLVGSGIYSEECKCKKYVHGQGHDPKKQLEWMKKELSLTKDQFSKIEKIKTNSAKVSEENRKKIKSLRRELHELLQADSVDKKQIRAKMEEISGLQVNAKMQWIEDRIEISELLTPEQRTKQKELRKKHFEEMKNRKDKSEKPRGK
jgi:Spy/CpxP family protein refolding chaperone